MHVVVRLGCDGTCNMLRSGTDAERYHSRLHRTPIEMHVPARLARKAIPGNRIHGRIRVHLHAQNH